MLADVAAPEPTPARGGLLEALLEGATARRRSCHSDRSRGG